MDQLDCSPRKRDEPHPFILADHIFNCVYNKNHVYDENTGVGREIGCLVNDENLNGTMN